MFGTKILYFTRAKKHDKIVLINSCESITFGDSLSCIRSFGVYNEQTKKTTVSKIKFTEIIHTKSMLHNDIDYNTDEITKPVLLPYITLFLSYLCKLFFFNF